MKTLFAIIALILVVSCLASADVVWQIGRFDNNFEEFAVAHNTDAYQQAFPKDVTYRVGADDPAKAWPFVHPGPADKWAGSKAHLFTILFDLPKEPSGTYMLTIDMANTQPLVPPTYRIDINGRSGRIKLPAGNEDRGPMDASRGKEYVLTLPFEASVLRRGQNKITLECVTGSWVVYDAISLSDGIESIPAQPMIDRLSLKPTVRLVKQGSKLRSVIELTGRARLGISDLTATVSSGGAAEQIALKPDLLGEIDCEISVDEVSRPTAVEVACGERKASCGVVPVKHWKVYVQPSAHVDIGFTDWQERVAERHNENVSTALDLMKQYPEFRWNTEAAWVEDNYLSMMPENRRAEFIKQARAGRLGCDAIYASMLTGICSHESFIRNLYYSRSAAKKYGIPWDIAMSSDVPTQIWTLPTVLAGAGINYFSAGLNMFRGSSFDKLFNKPFYWQGPDGSRVLTWFARQYRWANRIGLTTGIAESKAGIEDFIKSHERDDYPYDAVLAFGGYGDNRRLEAVFAETVHKWNERYAYPRVILCRGPEFFKYIEAGFGDKIPTFRGDAGVYWEDGAASSARETSAVRQAEEKLAAAEKLSALVSASGGGRYPKTEIDAAWKNAILFDEHTWGSSLASRDPKSEQTIHQWAVKAGFARDAEKQSDSILSRSMAELAKMVPAKKPSALVCNPLSWPVSGYVRVPSSAGKSVVLWAQDVPPVGYKVIPLSEAAPEPRIPEPAPPLENRYYRIEFDEKTGAVKSLYDKELKRELVDPSARYGINQYIYTISKDPDSRQRTDAEDATNAAVTVISRTYSHEGLGAHIEGTANRTKWTTEIILHDDCKRIDFLNRIVKEETFEKEAGYFAFPFALDRPEFYVQIPDGVVRPKKDMLPGGCMQWYGTQDFVAAADDRSAVVWTAIDSPLITLGDINRETFKSPLPIENGHLYAYAFNNYWFVNYKASQGGEMDFRFSLTSMPKYDPVAASRFGQSVRNPLLAAAVPTSGKPEAVPTSLASVSQRNIVIQAVKQAESGSGLIIRLREVAGKRTNAVVTLPAGRFKEAWACSLVEDPRAKLPIRSGKVSVSIPANGLATILVR